MKTIAASYLSGFYKACIAHGADPSILTPLIPGGRKALTTQGQRFPIGCITQMLTITMQTTGRKDIGLNIGNYLRPSIFGEAGQALLFCSSLRQAIEIHAKYLHLTQQIASINLEVSCGEARVIWKCAYENPEYARPLAEAALMSQTRIGRWLSWTHDAKVKAVHFRHSKPSYADEYQHYFNCPIVFSQAYDATIINAKVIDMPLPQANAKILSEICERLDRAAMDLTDTEPAHVQINRYFKTMIGQADYSIGALAEIMAMSERGLRRQLSLEGTSYRQLLERSRRELCEQYITNGQHSFDKIAQKLGYSEQSAFSRAFKKWYGQTPKVYVRAQEKLNIIFDQLAP